MRQAMANAIVGDDVLGDDPTIQKLEEKTAELLQKEAAIFVPSGTMANQIAIWLNTRRGDAIAVEEKAHIYHYEAAAPAIISSVMMRRVDGKNGIMDVESLRKQFFPVDPHFAPTTMVCVENTANKGGGTVYSLERLDRIAEISKQNKASTHLDGARLFNAAVASGIPASRLAMGYDTVSICFSKGLGAPVGSALCIPKDRMVEAKRARKAMGGGMRQSGILAAAAIHALDHNLPRLHEDHEKVQRLATGLQQADYEVLWPQSNMIYFKTPNAQNLVDFATEHGVLSLALAEDTIRLVAHLDVSPEEIDKAIGVFQAWKKK
jgi:threonine aldolase